MAAVRRFMVAAACALLCGCSNYAGAALPGPAHPVVHGLQVSPASLSMGPGEQATLSATEDGFSGNYTSTDTCSGIATVGTLNASQFTVTAVAPGTCNVSVSDGSNAQQVSVSVQTVIIGGQ